MLLKLSPHNNLVRQNALYLPLLNRGSLERLCDWFKDLKNYLIF